MQPPDSTAFLSRAQILVIVLSVAIVMVDGFDLQAIGFVAPEIAASWSVGIAAFGPVFSAALVGSMLGAMSAGSIARLLGLRHAIVVSVALFGGCTLLTAWSTDLITLTTLRFVTGLGLGAAVPMVMSLIAASCPERLRATLVVVALCGQPVGAIAGGALCARFIPSYGWQFAFYIGGVLPLLLLAAIFHVVPKDSPRNHATRFPGAANAGKLTALFAAEFRTKTLLLWGSVFLGSFFLYIIINWLPSSVRAVGYSLESSVLAIGLFNFGGIAGALILGVLMDRYGALRIVPIAFALAALGIATLDLARPIAPLFFAAAFLSGVAGYGGMTSLGALAAMLYPLDTRTTGIGWAMGVGRLGAAVGPLGTGFALAAGLEIGRLFYIAATAAAVVALCITLLARRSRTSESGV